MAATLETSRFMQLLEGGATYSPAAHTLTATEIATPLGPMIAIANEERLLLLEFLSRRGLESEIARLRRTVQATISEGVSPPLVSIREELALYFAGKLTTFSTPFTMGGSPFQQRVWRALLAIPYGQTCSYSDLAETIGQPTACRAVARANGSNQLAIVIPCHRVINADGGLGGYAGGIACKEWLLNHENRVVSNAANR